MRVLILAPEIFEGSLKEFQKNKNGFSMMVGDIARSLSIDDTVFVATNALTKQQMSGNVTFVDHSLMRFLKNLRFRYLIEGLKNAIRYPVPLRMRLRYIYYSLNKQCLKDILAETKPDIVSIQGIGYASKMCVELCREVNIKFSVTLHGLVGLNRSVKAPEHVRKYERDFLVSSEKEQIPVSVISSGIKERIVKEYGLRSGDNICVITNGANMDFGNDCSINIRERYRIPEGNQIAVCVGNITDNKNQIQIVRAYEKLPGEVQNKLTILFPGNEVDNDYVRTFIREKNYADHLILCGFVPREEIFHYYKAADINLFPSLNDGFGLPIIEAFMCGIPTVVFSDLDAIDDVYSPETMVLASERSDEAFASAVLTALQSTWDRERISSWGKQFSLDQMAHNYHNFFEKGRA